MTIIQRQIAITTLECGPGFFSRPITRLWTVLELNEPTLVRFGRTIHNIIDLDWNEAGTAQLLQAECGMRFYLRDVEVLS